MQKFHIIGINKTSIKIYFLLKKLKYKTTMSDLNDFTSIRKKISIKFNKNFFFKFHPKKILNGVNHVIFSTGVIKNIYDYQKYLKQKKNISEIDLFYKSSNWPAKSILFVTGSRGKTSVCKNIYKNLIKKKFFKKVIYLDRNNITFSTLPKYQDNFFLIAEVDYQTLLLAKSIKAKYRIFTSLFKTENKAFKNYNLYLKAKLKIFLNQRKKDFIFINNQTIKKLKINEDSFKSKVILLKSYKSIKENNNNIANITSNIIKETINEKY